MHRPWIVLVLLFLVAFAVYAFGAGDFFVFDSRPHLEHNAELPPELSNAPSFWNAVFGFENSPLGRPLTMLSFAVETGIRDGVSARGIRWTNAGIHLINGLLVYLLIGRLTALFGGEVYRDINRQRLTALLCTALWLLNPLHVSTVLYAIQRMSLLAATFMLAGLLTYLHYRDRADRPGGLAGTALAVTLFTGLAVLCKENGLLLPALIALLEWLRLPATTTPPRTDIWLNRLSVAGLSILTVTLLVSPLLFPEFFEHWYRNRDFDVWARLQTQARVLWHYVLWFTLPFPGWMGFYHDDIPVSAGLWASWSTPVAILAWLGVGVAAVRIRAYYPLITLGVLFFLLGHALESTVAPLEMVFEHRNYLPSVGLALLLALLLSGAIVNLHRPGRLLAGGLVVILGFVLVVRAGYWRSEDMLAFTHYRHHPESVRSLYHFANTTLRKGESAEDPIRSTLLIRAYGLYRKLDERTPDSLVAPATLLYLDARYFEGTERDKWLKRIDQAIRHWPMTASDRNALNLLAGCLDTGWCRAFDDRILTRLHALQQAHPGDVQFHELLSRFYLSKKRPEAALRWARSTLALTPSDKAYYLAASAAGRLGDQALVIDYMTTLQREDRWGRHNQSLIELFRHGRLEY